MQNQTVQLQPSAIAKKLRVAIYARVSTESQDFANQLNQLHSFIDGHSWEFYDLYAETEHGGEHNRPQFRRIMEDAYKRKFDVILVWAVDRFTREGATELLTYLRQLDTYGVAFVSYSESVFNSLDPIMRELMYAFTGVYAKMERIRDAARTSAALKTIQSEIAKKGYHVSKKTGNKIYSLGRKPSFDPALLPEIQRLHEADVKDRQIAKLLGITHAGSVTYAIKKTIPKMIAEGKLVAPETPKDYGAPRREGTNA